jgi:DNA-binding MarR family transcriptional regulator
MSRGALRDEERHVRGEDVERLLLGQLLREVHQALRVAFDEALQPRGLSLRQVGVLATLRRSPGLSNADLARRFFMTPQSTVELLSGLETAGLVVRRPHPAGGRALPAELTPAGTAKLVACLSVIASAEERLLSGISLRERHQLHDLLERVLAALRPASSEAGSPAATAAPRAG